MTAMLEHVAPVTSIAGRKPRTSNTAKRFNEVQQWLRQFVYFSADEDYDITTLWIMHTWLRDSDDNYVLDYTPRIAFIAEREGCGKTEALSRAKDLSFNGTVMNAPTSVAVANRISQKKIVPFIDEIDELFGKTSASKSELRSVLNVGYGYDGVLSRADADRPCFGPLAFAGICHNWLNNPVLKTTRSRTISLMMERKPKHVELEVFRRARHEGVAEGIKRNLKTWGRQHVLDVVEADPELPEGVDNRDRDLWFPLLAIAELTDDDDIIDRARAAVKSHVTNEPPENNMTDTDRLIVDLVRVFNMGHEQEWAPTKVLIPRLCDLPHGTVWRTLFGLPAKGEIDQSELLGAAKVMGRMLETYQITSIRRRFSDESGWGNCRAYQLADIEAELPADYAEGVPAVPELVDVDEWL